MASESYRGADAREWAEAGLDAIADKHEMAYVNQEDDYGDCLRGEWFLADDATRTIIWGTFGNYNAPGASHYTYAEVYDDETEYREALAEWEAKPEYLERDDEADDVCEVIVGNIGTVYDDADEEEARRLFADYVAQSKSGIGRAAGEEVSLFLHGELADCYTPDVE